MTYVSVVVDNNTNATDELYTYRWDLTGTEPSAGCKVTVPFSIRKLFFATPEYSPLGAGSPPEKRITSTPFSIPATISSRD